MAVFSHLSLSDAFLRAVDFYPLSGKVLFVSELKYSAEVPYGLKNEAFRALAQGLLKGLVQMPITVGPTEL